MDEFTEKLLERSKARKDFLKNKFPERKRRTALLNENQITSSNIESQQISDDAPKRQCLDSEISNYESAQSCENKENTSTDELSYVPYVASEKKGLAALRRNKKNSDLEEKVIPTISVTESQESQGFVKSPSITKMTYNFEKDNDENAEINYSSDDDFSSDDEMDHEETNVKHVENEVETTCFTKEDYFHSSDTLNKKVNSPVTYHSPHKVEMLSPTFQSPQKPTEANSPAKFYNSKKIELSPTKYQSPPKIKPSIFRSTSSIRLSPRADSAQKKEGNSPVDPAELPLSARKALFEKALFHTPVKVETNAESNLSVAQRAAMFEKVSVNDGQKKTQKEVSKFTLSTLPKSDYSEPKSSSHTVGSSAEKKTKKLFPASPSKSPLSPNESVLSPSKSAGIHTRSVQKCLMDNVTTDWRKKDIVAKATEERKTEISALLNHWEKVSTAENNTQSMDYRHIKSITLSEIDKVFIDNKEEEEEEEEFSEENEDISEEREDMLSDNNDEVFSENETSYDNDDEERNSPEPEMEDNSIETSGKHEPLSQTSSEVVNDIMAVCDEMNEVLDAAVNQMPMPPILPLSSLSSKGSSISFTSSSSTSSSGTPPARKESNRMPRNPVLQQPCNIEEASGDSDTPLLHTISFYRKQKQKKRSTPVQTIVRKEPVRSPPSPEVDRIKIIQEKIKLIQEEILTQQTVISQTSQALNLCHATEEFFGSTEQVECERLLLIATQKRQALLNEIQRLKTHGALGEKLENETGTLIIRDITLPLKRDFIASQLQSKSCDVVHYFMCLLRHGPQVITTQMLSTMPNEVTNGALCFTNHITIRNLAPDFSVVFEVYALQTKKEVLPHDKKYHIKKDHSKIRLTPKSKKGESRLQMPVITSPGGPNAVRTPSFGVVGFTRLTLQNHERRTYTLDKVPFSSPLDGVLLVKMQLDTEYNIIERGFLTMFEDVSGLGAWHRRWCVLNNHDLSFWKYPDDEKRKEPILQIDMRQCITKEVKLVPREVCARQHTFELMIVRPSEKGDKNTLISMSVNTLTRIQYLLSADTKEERILWCKRLNDSLTNVRRWNPKALKPMDAKK